MVKVKYMILCLALVAGIGMVANVALAIPPAVEAKSEFMLAEKLFNEGKFYEATNHADKARKILGKTNSRIEYLLAQAFFNAGDSWYKESKEAVNAFFKVTPESESSSKQYADMVALYAQVEAKIEGKKAQEVAAWNKEDETWKQQTVPMPMKQQEAILIQLAADMVQVPGGCFQMGNTFGNGHDNAKLVHNVCVKSYQIGKYEVTQTQWRAVMGYNPAKNQKGENYPVENVDWSDAQKFINKLNSITGMNYRLPTEAEWEYAARSGGKNEEFAGGSDADSVAWYDGNSDKQIHLVGQKQPNGLGIYDMSGNVCEWCSDWYGEDYYRKSPKDNPQGPVSGEYRVLRGGSWDDSAAYTRAANRKGSKPVRSNDYGFRLARTN